MHVNWKGDCIMGELDFSILLNKTIVKYNSQLIQTCERGI